MKKTKNIHKIIARFTRWSRKAWAVFASLHREVQIGCLKISVINKSFIKNVIEKVCTPLLLMSDFSISDLLSIDELLTNIFGINFSEKQLISIAIQNNTKKLDKKKFNKIYLTPKVLKTFYGNF